MKKVLLILLGLAGTGILRAEEAVTTNPATSSPSPEISWTNVPVDCWGEEALPYAQEGLKAWYQESDPKKKVEIGEKVLELANRANAGDLGLELFAGRPIAQAELHVPTNAVAMPLTVIKEWDPPARNQYDAADASAIRRIGPTNFELWTPKQGWLFDEKGSVLAEAKVPRRDGMGRQWYGAFLPDGQWITTDLWQQDNRLYLFSKQGKLINSYPVGLARWARADLTGSHWVVGMTEGYGDIFFEKNTDLKISPLGWSQRLWRSLKRMHFPVSKSRYAFVEKIPDARELLNPRELGCRGFFCDMKAQSDDRAATLGMGAAGHGRWCFWTFYALTSPQFTWSHCLPGRYYECFGFFPESLAAWIGKFKYPMRPETARERFQSWIIAPDGKVLGWLPAERVGDDPDGKRMWFVDEKGCLLKVAPDGAVSDVLQPVLPGATGSNTPFAHVLFPDLKLGFFHTKPGHLVLARWN